MKSVVMGMSLAALLTACRSDRIAGQKAEPAGGQWYKGNLHMHTRWSDGNAFPEDAAAWYRDHGYHFVCLSDHHALQTSTNGWLEVGTNNMAILDYLSRHAKDVEVKEKGGKQFVRLKTIWETKQALESAESFFVFPGLEISPSGLQRPGDAAVSATMHMNAVNIDYTPEKPKITAEIDLLRHYSDEIRAWSAERKTPACLMLNHPTWSYFDVPPETLIRVPEVRLFELCNANAAPKRKPHASWYTLEKYWDVVNAFRIEDGHPPVFGTATDDAHHYLGGGRFRPGHGWIWVRAARLTAADLIGAMQRGDFYASTGVMLADVSFDASRRLLSVKIVPEVGVTYEVTFTTTRAGFDRTVGAFDDPVGGKGPARKGERYSDDIGRLVKRATGEEASYAMAPEDLYVRAKVVASRKKKDRAGNEPAYETAWTQPYGWREWQASRR
jgi:hypothetical protein